MTQLDVDSLTLTGLLLAAKKTADTGALSLFEALEAAATGQVNTGLKGGRIISGTSSGGHSVSFSIPSGAGSELSPTSILRAYVALRAYCREVAGSLGLNVRDAANNSTIADVIESVLLAHTTVGDDYTQARCHQ